VSWWQKKTSGEMKNYNLSIACYNIRFESSSEGPELVPSEKFFRNICHEANSDILIQIHSGKYNIPETAERVFHAPFVEEINGIQINNKANFWSVWSYLSDLYIRTIFPLSSSDKNAVLKISLISKKWDLWIEDEDNKMDPFEYPLDGLILYYLTVIHGDIMIHASGVNNNGKGYLFSGVSGKGKTTMAKLWDNRGAKVIHDDRLIIRKTGNGYTMYNTPVYNDDRPLQSVLNKIFLIEHGEENKLTPVKGANSVSLVMANCIQHNWGHEIITGLLESVSFLCETIPVVKLYFTPDVSVIDYIVENE
jgi:hypothetical protein